MAAPVTAWLFSRDGVAKSPCKCGSLPGIYSVVVSEHGGHGFHIDTIDFSSAKYARLVAPFVLSESMELHRISLLLFQLMIVRLVTKGDALALKLLQPLTVDLNACGGRNRCVVPEDIAHVVEQPGG